MQKALQTVESEESVFRVGLQVGCQSLQIRRFSVESGLHTTTLFSFPLSGRKSGEFQPAEHHRLSPLRHRSLWGRKVRKTSSAASMGLQNLVDPASSHMLVSKPFLKRSRARFLPGPPLITLRVISTEVGNPTSLHTEVGFLAQASNCLVRAWCGPGAGLAILRWAQDCRLNPAPATGLPQPFLRHTQDCPDALPAGAVLARAQPCDGACPAVVELPGFRHVVYAQNKGQAACEERVSELRVEGQVMPPPPRAIVVHAAAWEDVRRSETR